MVVCVDNLARKQLPFLYSGDVFVVDMYLTDRLMAVVGTSHHSGWLCSPLAAWWYSKISSSVRHFTFSTWKNTTFTCRDLPSCSRMGLKSQSWFPPLLEIERWKLNVDASWNEDAGTFDNPRGPQSCRNTSPFYYGGIGRRGSYLPLIAKKTVDFTEIWNVSDDVETMSSRLVVVSFSMCSKASKSVAHNLRDEYRRLDQCQESSLDVRSSSKSVTSQALTQ
ncbi:unnamed protein product [Citrullus colocynthis]|uniref:Uncharacterized protein n=1 Tax=Citrullus colocynthis TaxID=252529 RepID=A0ABP0YZW6_9ROSI